MYFIIEKIFNNNKMKYKCNIMLIFNTNITDNQLSYFMIVPNVFNCDTLALLKPPRSNRNNMWYSLISNLKVIYLYIYY